MSSIPQPPVSPYELSDERKHVRRVETATWAVRIILIVLLWLGLPFWWLFAIFGVWDFPDFYGFLGNSLLIWTVLLFVWLTVLILSVGRKKRNAIVAAAICIVAVTVIAANHFYAQGKFVDPDAYDAQAAYHISQTSAENLQNGAESYRPFDSTLIARLDEPSTLTFAGDDDLPRVDSATALLPMASAFVTATYPQDEVTVQWELGDFDEGFVNGYQSGYMDGCEAKSAGQPVISWLDQESLRNLQQVHGPNYATGFKLGYDAGLPSGWEHVEANSNQFRVDGGEVKAEADSLLRETPKPIDAVFQYNNSSQGFTRLADGRTDVFFGAKADADQAAYAESIGVDFEYTPIGREGFVFLVNANNPVDSLTIEQVKGIYAGRITNWKEVGGNDEPIVAYQRNENSGSQSAMRLFMADDTLVDAPAHLTRQSMGGLVAEVANYDNGAGAIGYSFRYYVTDLVGSYNVKLLAIEGVSPTLENIATEAYPITSSFFAVTRAADDSPDLARFIEWILGPQGQELVEKSGYARLSSST